MGETELDLRGILGVLQRQFRLILTTIVVVVGLATIVAFALTPTYTSSALILVDPSTKNLLDPESQMMSTSADSARIDSEVELARSDSVLLRVIEQEELVKDPEFGVSLGLTARIMSFLRLREPTLPTGTEALNEALTSLRNAISVQRRGLTYLISVQVRSEDPEKAARIANAATEAYIADQLASKVDSILASRSVLQARTTQARQAIVTSEESFDSFIEQNIARITRDTGNADFATTQEQIRQLQAARTESASVAASVEQSLQNNNWDAIVASLQSDALDALNQQRNELSQNLSTAAEGSPVQISLRDELAQIEERLRSQTQSEVTALRDAVQQNQAREEELRQSMRADVLSSNLSADVLTQLYELQQNAELARAQYQTLLSRSQDLEAQADLQVADSRIVSPALPPQHPSFPNKTLILTLAALLAAGLGIGLAFLYENLIGGFTSQEQVEAVLRTPVAAVIPRERVKSEKDSLSNLMVQSPLSIFAESIRRARASIEQALRPLRHGDEGRGAVIMVTSTAPNEGKTTFSLSLARSYALSGQRVLLIDCDLRKPSIHRHLGLEPSHGLMDFLTSDIDNAANIGSIITRDELTNVTVITGTRRSDIPTDQLLAGAGFVRLIHSARQTFDTVILDTPPIGPVVDGLYISAFADVICFVARWASTSQQDARKSIASLTASKQEDATIMAVLNQQDDAGRTYQRRYAGYYSYNS